MPRWTQTAEERFWANVDRSDLTGCWSWMGGAYVGGYGRLWVNGKATRAHRFSYELHNGPITDGLHVCHRCDNPPCVNPAHLFLGTPAVNHHDKMSKGRATPPLWAGDEHPMGKLTQADVDEIRRRPDTAKAIAAEFGISTSQVSRIRTGILWADSYAGTGPAPQNAAKTHCPQGHPYSGDNLYVRASGARQCKACKRSRPRLSGPAAGENGGQR